MSNKIRLKSDLSIKSAFRISGLYLIASILWIILSDGIVQRLSLTADQLTKIEMAKGLLFVIMSALLLFYFLKKFTAAANTESADYISDGGKKSSPRRDWFDPILLSAIFVCILALLFWMYYISSVEKIEKNLSADINSVKEAITLRLKGNEEYITLLSHERSSGIINENNFGEFVLPYIKDHQEFINITWVDSSYKIKTAAPLASNKQIVGLNITLPQPLKAAQLAQKKRHPVYTDVFEAIQGKPSFEIWMPVYRGDQFLGFLAGVYSCGKFLKSAVPAGIVKHNYVRLFNKEGGLLSNLELNEDLDRNISAEFFPDPPANGMYIRLNAYGIEWWNKRSVFYGLIIFVLVISLSYGIWQLKINLRENSAIKNALFLSEIKYRSFFENSMDAILLTMPEGAILSANPAACRMFGRSEEELIELGRNAVVDSTDERLDFLLRKRSEEGKARGELTLVKKDGTKFPAELSSALFKDDKGRILTSMVIRDVSDRRNAEEKIRRSEQKFRNVFENSIVGKTITDFNGGIVCNPAFSQILGYSEEELTRMRWQDITYPDDIKRNQEIVDSLLAGKMTKAHWQKRYLHKNGSLIWADISTFLQRDESGDPLYFINTIYDITNRKLTEEKLKFSEELFRKVFENSVVGKSITSMDGHLRVNNAFTNIIGYSEDELSKTKWWEITHEDDISGNKEILNSLLKGEIKQAHWEKRYIHKNGNTVWVDISTAVQFDAEEKPLYFITEIVDITERKAAEEALLYHRELLDEVGRVAKIGGWEFDPASGNGSWTKEVAIIHDLDPDDETNVEIGLSFYTDESRLRIEKAIKGAVESGTPYNLELELITAKGNRKWVHSIGTPVFSDGKVVNVRGSFQDITERKKTEKEILVLNKKLSDLIESIKQLSSAHDLEEIQKIVASSARKLIGSDGATFVFREGNNCYYADEDAISPLWKGKRFPMSACISGWVMLNNKNAVIPDIYKDPRIPVDAYKSTFVKSLAMVPIGSLNPVGAVGIYWKENYTPGKIEIEILNTLADTAAIAIDNFNLLRDLELRVEKRTGELKEANRELESFSYSVSHDLRAPLRHISGYVELLQKKFKESLPDKAQYYLNNVTESVQSMGRLIDDLLKFSRTGRYELVVETIDMNSIVKDALNEVMEDNSGREIEFKIADLPSVPGDSATLRTVWINLISNAVKFTGKTAKAVIEINSFPEDHQIVFLIKDNGVGFDMAYSQKLFGVFQRLHPTEEFEGTGIGLANVRRIILKHGGRTWAESSPGNGAAFFFTLPIEKEKDNDGSENNSTG